jgi:hypothetical protein
MSVRVNKSRQDYPAAKIQFFCAAGTAQTLNAPPLSGSRNPVAVNKQRAIADDSKLAQRSPPPGDRPAQSQEFRAAGNQPIRHEGVLRY